MPLKNLLVVVDPSEGAANRIDVAVALAREHGAHLVGLHASAPPPVPPLVARQISGAPRAALVEALREAAREAERLFRERTEGTEVRTAWRHREGEAAEIAALHARYADLAVAGPVPAEGEEEPRNDFLVHLIMGAGRPVLCVPPGREPDTLGRRIVVAWNATRESARAVSDALPLLTRADKVWVLAVNPGTGGPSEGAYSSRDIAQSLGRHGIRAEHERVFEYAKGAGEVIVDRAAALGADLVVTGAYSHSRFRELVLGGATRDLLRHAELPVLMSH